MCFTLKSKWRMFSKLNTDPPSRGGGGSAGTFLMEDMHKSTQRVGGFIS